MTRSSLTTLSPRLEAAVFWGGTIAIGASTFGVLSVLSRRLGAGGLSEISVVMALSLVMSVVAQGVQLRAASLAVIGCGGAVPWRFVATAAVLLGVASPVLSRMLAISTIAVVMVAVQTLPAAAAAARRGTLIGEGRPAAVGVSLLCESAVRLGAGVIMGYEWRGAGVAGSLVLAAVVVVVLFPSTGFGESQPGEGVTSLAHTVASTGLMMVLANIDVLLAHFALGPVGADQYDLGAVPAKGVFLALIAVGWLAIAGARARANARSALTPVIATLGLGTIGAGAFLLLRPVVAAVFGKPEATATLVILTGAAMAVAAATSACVCVAVARGAAKPWVPLVLAIGVIVAMSTTHPTPSALGLTVLLAQVGALAASVVLVARTYRS